ncbi:MAG: hypothetical protein K9M45_03960, partial [Kiritimatiellales bacterium]|nr:hypothetical protein [Kiritimatiellales bacterium]
MEWNRRNFVWMMGAGAVGIAHAAEQTTPKKPDAKKPPPKKPVPNKNKNTQAKKPAGKKAPPKKPVPAPPRKPNVIVIMTDDQG